MARAAGLLIDWDDLDELSRVTPLLARVYPNGSADVNHFHAAGGIGFVIRELLDAGLMHADIRCVHGGDLRQQAQEPWLDGTQLRWREPPAQSLDSGIVRGVADPFDQRRRAAPPAGQPRSRRRQDLGGRAGVPRHRRAGAKCSIPRMRCSPRSRPAQLEGDFVAVVRGQGPRANGMPELHKLTPTLSLLQDRGQRIALLTDGRMSGASGKVLAAIHVSPEAADARRDRARARRRPDPHRCRRRRDGRAGRCRRVGGAHAAAAVVAGQSHRPRPRMFALMRAQVGTAEQGACSLFVEESRSGRGLNVQASEHQAAERLALIADIGGTNARFALTDPAADVPAMIEPRSLVNAEFASLQHAAEHYLDEVGIKPRSAAIAVASPVHGEEIRLTNRAWSFTRSELQRALGSTAWR